MIEPRPILVGIDFSSESRCALAHATALARRFDRELVLAHSLPVPIPPFREGLDARWHSLTRDQREAARTELSDLRAQLSAQGLRASYQVPEGSADVALTEIAERAGVGLIAIGTHGRTGVKRFLLGSVAERTARLASTDVLIARAPLPQEHGYRRVLVPVDFSEGSRTAVARAVGLASRGGSVQLMHCWEIPILFPHGELTVAALSDELRKETREEVLARGRDLVARYRRADVDVTFTELHGRPAKCIQDQLQEGDYDLVVIGSSGHGRLHRWLLGSVAENTVRHAPCSVWIARD